LLQKSRKIINVDMVALVL